jgi:hypothetical protein
VTETDSVVSAETGEEDKLVEEVVLMLELAVVVVEGETHRGMTEEEFAEKEGFVQKLVSEKVSLRTTASRTYCSFAVACEDTLTNVSAWALFKSVVVVLLKVRLFTDPELVELPPPLDDEFVIMIRFEFVEFELGLVAVTT